MTRQLRLFNLTIFAMMLLIVSPSVIQAQTQPTWSLIALSQYWAYPNAPQPPQPPYVYPFPSSFAGGYDGCDFPQPPYTPPYWWVNGVDTSKTATEIYRSPGSRNTSTTFYNIKGFEFLGSFNGKATNTGDSRNSVTESVFFHQNTCFSGGPEYGFYENMLNNTLYFYWSINTNCGAATTSNGCFSTDSNNLSYAMNQQGSQFVVTYTPTKSSYYYLAYLFEVSGQYKFQVEVLDPDTKAVVYQWTQIPDSWFPAAGLYNSWGHFTATMVKTNYDSSNTTITATPNTNLTVNSIDVGQ